MNRRPLTRLQITGLILVGILLALCALLAALRRPAPALPPAATESIGDTVHAAETADSAASRTKKARKTSTRPRPATPPPAPRSPLDESF